MRSVADRASGQHLGEIEHELDELEVEPEDAVHDEGTGGAVVGGQQDIARRPRHGLARREAGVGDGAELEGVPVVVLPQDRSGRTVLGGGVAYRLVLLLGSVDQVADVQAEVIATERVPIPTKVALPLMAPPAISFPLQGS